MNNFKKNNRFGGGGFKPRDRGDFNDRPKEMFEATCASCGKTCQVPFRPNGKKPVYCNDCFAKNGGGDRGGDRDNSFKKPYNPSFSKPSYPRNDAPAPQNNDNKLILTDVSKQLQMVNSKLDRMITLLEASTATPKPVSPKTIAKKAAKKKK